MRRVLWYGITALVSTAIGTVVAAPAADAATAVEYGLIAALIAVAAQP